MCACVVLVYLCLIVRASVCVYVCIRLVRLKRFPGVLVKRKK